VINSRIGGIKRFFKWCASRQHIPADVYTALTTVDGLRRGRSDARESVPVVAVARENVYAVLPFVSPQVAALIQVQYLCGMRPGEVTRMRRCELDTSGDIWLYTPDEHKNAWRGHVLVKAIPRAAQDVLSPFLPAKVDAYLFSPKDADHWYRANRESNPQRKTPVYPCELRRREEAKRSPRRKAARPKRDHYDTDSYRQAVLYGISNALKAGIAVAPWTPNQLWHSIATEISQSIGQQAAQRWLGHAKLDTTGIYVEKQVSELIEIAQALDRKWSA